MFVFDAPKPNPGSKDHGKKNCQVYTEVFGFLDSFTRASIRCRSSVSRMTGTSSKIMNILLTCCVRRVVTQIDREQT